MTEREIERALEKAVFEDDTLSRRRFFGRAGSLGLLGVLSSALAACGIEGEAKNSASSDAAASGKPIVVDHPRTKIGDLVFSNWPLYIDKSVIKAFEKKYGANVKYIEEINDNFEFFGKVRQQLAQGRSIGRDIVTLTDYMAARWVRDGYTEPIDKRNVPNSQNLVENLRTINYDPARAYTLPWQSGGIGIGYDRRRTGRTIESVEDLFDPKFKGRVTFLQEPYDSAGLVLLGMGIDATNANIDQILKAIDKIGKAKDAGQIRRFTGNDYTTDLTKGNTWLAVAYSGDLVQLHADNPNLQFVYPKEGSMLFTDNMMMPKGVEHPYAAETMMNYVYEPEVAATIAAYVNYISPVAGVKEVLLKKDPKIANNPLIFPPEDVQKRLHPYPNLSPADERTMQQAMAEVTGA
jgi:spermidine/putrescine transport system substrate-binding protein